MSTRSVRMNHTVANGLLTVVGLTGVVALFLPFTFDESPVSATGDGLWQVALPFFLAVPVAATAAHWVIAGSLSRPERIVAYAMSVASAGLTILFLTALLDREWPRLVQDWLAFAATMITMSAGGCLLLRNRVVEQSREFGPVLAIQAAYLANALLCLITFLGEWQVGAYCVVVTVIAYLLQIILVSAQPKPDYRR
jgi:hypothetical protein